MGSRRCNMEFEWGESIQSINYNLRETVFQLALLRFTVNIMRPVFLHLALNSDHYFTKKYGKMNVFSFYFVILSLVPFGSALDYRGIFGNWFGGGVQSPCTGCPFRNCLNDRSVILGYCCGCARVSDFLPIDCPGLHLNCPNDGRRLCRDYDYMLNCCCP